MSATPKLVLYFDTISLFSRIILAFAKYHNIPLEHRTVSVPGGQHVSDEHAARNPFKTVPTLVNETDDVTIYESSAILIYLAQLFNLTGKYGIGSTQAAQARTINAVISNNHHVLAQMWPTTTRQIILHILADTPFSLSDLESNTLKLKDELNVLSTIIEKNNGTLTKGEWTLADVHAALCLGFLLTGELGLGLIKLSDFPILEPWYNTINADFWIPEEFDPVCKGLIGTITAKVPESRLADKQ